QQLADLSRPAPQGMGLHPRSALVRSGVRHRCRGQCVAGLIPLRASGVVVVSRYRRSRHELCLELRGELGADLESAVGGPPVQSSATQGAVATAATFLLNTRTFLPYSMKMTRNISSSVAVTARPT